MNMKRRGTRHAGKSEAAEHASAPASAVTKMPRLEVANGSVRIVHADPKTGERLLMKAFRTTSPAFVRGIIKQLANVAAKGKKPDEDELNLMLVFVIDAEPIDEFHALLLTQAAATHVLSMHFSNYVGSSENICQQDSGERILNKLFRTFILQMAASNHYRAQREQMATGQEAPVEVESVTPLAITDARAIAMGPLQQPQTIQTAPKEPEQ